jgi:hypothetical protein
LAAVSCGGAGGDRGGGAVKAGATSLGGDFIPEDLAVTPAGAWITVNFKPMLRVGP